MKNKTPKATYEKALYAAGESLKAQDLKQFEHNVLEAYTETLEQALKRCYGDASKSLWSQARQAAIQAGLEMMERELAATGLGAAWEVDYLLSQSRVSRIRPEDVQQATAKFYKDGLSPATINKRLNCLSKMGVSVEGLRVKDPKKLKWYLPEDKLSEVLEWCTSNGYGSLCNLIAWTTRTGLRIEESLRLSWDDFGTDSKGPYVKVSGTKTSSSQATLPLGQEVNGRMHRWFGTCGNWLGPFHGKYEQYQQQWDHVREHFGWKDDPTATLKALRRSAARYLHVDCNMPLHMVQQYLRHESMDTTLEYLRLTGGYGTEEMRRYLK